MTHLPDTDPIHRHVGDPATALIPIEHLTVADVSFAEWRSDGVTSVTKTIGDGITVISGSDAKTQHPEADLAGVSDDAAVLVIDIVTADTADMAVGRWRWQARAGENSDAPVVARGYVVLSLRVPA